MIVSRSAPRCGRPSGAADRRAFSLVEMLVVIGILAVLLSLLMPALGKVRKTANRASCASNLHQIHHAASQFKTEFTFSQLPVAGWKAAYAKYLGSTNDKDHPLYNCPEETRRGSTAATGTVEFANLALRVFRGTQYWDIPLAPGPRCQKLNSNADGSYYELWFEESPENENLYIDNNDVVINVQKNTDGTTTMTLNGAGSYAHDTVFMWDVVNNVKVWGQIYSEVQAGEKLTSSNFSSYGFNYNVNEVWGDADKILALDYVQVVANPNVDNWSNDPAKYLTVKKDGLQFARHSNQVNVLYGDGHVVLTPIGLHNEYDYSWGATNSIARKYWYP